MRVRFICRVLTVLTGFALLSALPQAARAESGKGTLIDYIRARDDLSKRQRRAWEKAIRVRFGGDALEDETDERVELGVAKQIIAAAIWTNVKPKRGVKAAWDGWHGAIGYVPPPIATHYQLLALQGRKPRGRMIDLAFKFPDYYSEEIAADLVAWWQDGLHKGTIPDAALAETREALAATLIKMRPLLLDKLRQLARLDRDLRVARGARRAEIETDIKGVEKELTRSFKGVGRRPEVLNPNKRPFDRLRIQLEDMGRRPTKEDRLLDPDAPPPPRRMVPIRKPRIPPKVDTPDAPASIEPAEPPPPPPPPPQPRPGDPDPNLKPLSPFGLKDLIERYHTRLVTTVEPWLGTPYKWGGGRAGLGTDCSGFTKGVFLDGFSINLPRVSRDQFRTGRSVPRNALRTGDLVFFDTLDKGRITHVGVYIGDGKFAHASSSKGVTYAKLDKRYYRRAYRGARRVLAYPR